jgi:elongation factor P
MLSITDLKTGVTIEYNGEPFIVIAYEHGKVAMSGAFVRTKLRNLITGNVIDVTFKGNVSVSEADIEKRRSNFLYAQDDKLFFMDIENFEQYELSKNSLGERAKFLKEGQEVTVMLWKGRAINVDLPIKMEFKVVSTPPGVRGDTVSGATKPAVLDSGATVAVPLFINEGDIIRVNTQEGTYVERVK